MSRSRRKPTRLPGTESRDYPLVVLRQALRPFANVEAPETASGDAVWLYVGKQDPNADPAPLRLADFQRAREALR